MTGKGELTSQPTRALRWMIAGHLLWIGALCALGAWWGVLVIRYAQRIHELESAAGIVAQGAESPWLKTQRMIVWEGSFFLFLLILSAAAMFSVYWRDARRQKGLQAFFASVTHELRTPLTSIRLQAESLEENLVDGDPVAARKLTHRLLEDTLRLESQVERTLELARVEGGGSVLSQAIRIKPWLERSLATWSGMYGDRISIETEIADVQIEADPAALQVIFRNLLENAVRHGGRQRTNVQLRCVRDSAGSIQVSFRDDGTEIGNASLRFGKLFERGAESQGAGVGLYLVRTLMERMGGTVEFRSGKGFEVLLVFRPGRQDG